MRLFALTLIAMLFSAGSVAQVTIIGSTIDPQLFTSGSFLQVSISNGGPAIPVVFSGEVRSKDGVHVLIFRSGPYGLGSGLHQLRSSALVMQQFAFGADQRSRTAALEGRLPAGNYTFCIKVSPAQDGEFQDEFCDAFQAEDRLFMDLVYPYDGDTIDEVRPSLSWSITSGKVPPGQVVKALLVPLTPGADAYQAIAAARPIFVADHLQRTVIPYPMGVQNLERGRCYAWQAERFLEGASIDRTEAWKFCVRKPRTPNPDRYVLVGSHASDAVVDAVDHRLYIRYDGQSGAAGVVCKVIRSNGTLTDPRTSDLAVDPAVRNTGPGLYEVDLAPCGLGIGEYALTVLSGTNRTAKLRFRITE
ncbi:MAG: hypothetical protein ABI432_11285 [Flavobacteriales bacterium]